MSQPPKCPYLARGKPLFSHASRHCVHMYEYAYVYTYVYKSLVVLALLLQVTLQHVYVERTAICVNQRICIYMYMYYTSYVMCRKRYTSYVMCRKNRALHLVQRLNVTVDASGWKHARSQPVNECMYVARKACIHTLVCRHMHVTVANRLVTHTIVQPACEYIITDLNTTNANSRMKKMHARLGTCIGCASIVMCAHTCACA
jgi:hypothetical protein